MSVDSPVPRPDDETGLSRRRLIGGAGAAGLALGLLSGTGSAQAAPAAPEQAPAEPLREEPMVVHLRDVRTGELDLYAGTRHHRVHDPALAAALAHALG